MIRIKLFCFRLDLAIELLRGLLVDSRKSYPEVSFAYVDVMVSGVLGVAPDALADRVITTHRLPTNMTWANASSIAIGAHSIVIAHTRDESGRLWSSFSHERVEMPWASDADLVWTARFAVDGGSAANATLWVNGMATAATVEHQAGDPRLVLLAVNVTVPRGESSIVATV